MERNTTQEKNMLLDQKTDWGIEPYNHVPEHLQEQLPKSIVPMWRLHESEEAKKLAELCRRAFTPYLLSDGWLSSREFIDNPYRYHIEYVPEFHSIFEDSANEEDRTRVVNLEIMALGLEDLLGQLNPEYFSKPSARVFASEYRDELSRRLVRLLETRIVHGA